jgi:hypothetical protein
MVGLDGSEQNTMSTYASSARRVGKPHASHTFDDRFTNDDDDDRPSPD